MIRRTVRSLACLVATAVFFALTPTPSAACQQEAVNKLQRLHPPGFNVYINMRKKGDFLFWLECQDLQLDLATAVHESIHILTSEYDAYPLLNGQRLPRIADDPVYYPPSALQRYFDTSSTYVETYIVPGTATSSEQFGFLLDEFNAYTHDLNAAIALQPLARPGQYASHRDGLAALMSFVFSYVEEARRAYPQTWQQLQTRQLRSTVKTLWEQAEQVMANSCLVPNFGEETPKFLSNVCRSTAQGAMGHLLGRPPLCPVSCARPQIAQSVQSFQ